MHPVTSLSLSLPPSLLPPPPLVLSVEPERACVALTNPAVRKPGSWSTFGARLEHVFLRAKIFAGAQRDSVRLGKAARRVGSARKLALLTSTKSPARISFAAPSQPGYGGYRGCGLDQWLALVSDAKFAGFARSGDSRRFSTTSRNAAGQEPASTFSRAR